MFPFKIVFRKRLDVNLNSDQIEKLLVVSTEMLYQKDVDNIEIEGRRLVFKVPFLQFGSSWHIMTIVDGGVIEVSQNNYGQTVVSYSITIIWSWIMAVIFGGVFYLSDESISYVFAFSAMIFFSEVILLFPHSLFFKEIIKKSEVK